MARGADDTAGRQCVLQFSGEIPRLFVLLGHMPGGLLQVVEPVVALGFIRPAEGQRMFAVFAAAQEDGVEA
jgi:hypothetical protein